MHAVADRRQLSRINVALVAFAAAQVALSVLLVRLGGALGAAPLLPPLQWAHEGPWGLTGATSS